MLEKDSKSSWVDGNQKYENEGKQNIDWQQTDEEEKEEEKQKECRSLKHWMVGVSWESENFWKISNQGSISSEDMFSEIRD